MTRLRILLLILYVLLIFFLSSRPYLTSPGPDFAAKDKVAHFSEYFILGTLLFAGIGFTVSRSARIAFLFLVAVGVSVGAVDELFQGMIPGRRTDMLDWGADALGVSLGVLLSILIANRARRGKTSPVRDRS